MMNFLSTNNILNLVLYFQFSANVNSKIFNSVNSAHQATCAEFVDSLVSMGYNDSVVQDFS